jgi:hypothetical protein
MKNLQNKFRVIKRAHRLLYCPKFILGDGSSKSHAFDESLESAELSPFKIVNGLLISAFLRLLRVKILGSNLPILQFKGPAYLGRC